MMKSTRPGTQNVNCFRLKNTCILCNFNLEELYYTRRAEKSI